MDTKHNFAGRNLFERAQVDEWLAYVGSTRMGAAMYGAMGIREMSEAERKEYYATFPKALVPVEQHFKTNTYFCGDHMTIADMAFLTVVWGGARGPKLPDSVMKKLPNLSKWYNNMVSQDFFKKCFGTSFAMKTDYPLPDQEAVAQMIAAKAQGGKA